jgi:uncharacterized protein
MPMSRPSTVAAQESEILTGDSSFQFACHPDLPCFTQCCRDVNIYLTPYDVLRLRRALNMGSREFLEKHTRQLVTKGSHIPVVQLAMDEQTLSCKLLADNGCLVYGDRPWACRMYPLDLADREGQYRFMVTRQRCAGLGEKRTVSVQHWLNDQGVPPYQEMELAFHQIMPPPLQPGQRMDDGLAEVFFLAYDLDQFALLLDDSRFRDLYEVDDESWARAREDAEALLLLAFRFIRGQLDELMAPAWTSLE